MGWAVQMRGVHLDTQACRPPPCVGPSPPPQGPGVLGSQGTPEGSGWEEEGLGISGPSGGRRHSPRRNRGADGSSALPVPSQEAVELSLGPSRGPMGPPLGLRTAELKRLPLRGGARPASPLALPYSWRCTRDAWHSGSRLEPRGASQTRRMVERGGGGRARDT